MLTRQEYLDKKRALEKELARLDDIREDLRALDRVYAMLSSNGGRKKPEKEDSAENTVRNNLRDMPIEFTRPEVVAHLNKYSDVKLSSAAVYGALRRLIDANEVEVKTKGGGKKSTIYRRIEKGLMKQG
jgi:hypothetical protein